MFESLRQPILREVEQIQSKLFYNFRLWDDYYSYVVYSKDKVENYIFKRSDNSIFKTIYWDNLSSQELNGFRIYGEDEYKIYTFHGDDLKYRVAANIDKNYRHFYTDQNGFEMYINYSTARVRLRQGGKLVAKFGNLSLVDLPNKFLSTNGVISIFKTD